MNGWIKMHRKLLDNPIVCKDSDHLAVWTYLLLNASHKDHPAVFGKEKIILQPGQLITGRKAISERLRVSESKIQRILSCFESEHQIEQQTGNKSRLITVLSWLEYQDSEQQDELEMNNKRTTNEQQVNTNKNLRIKELENLKDTTTPTSNPFRLFETEGFGMLTEVLGQKIGDLIDDFGERWVCEAMKEASFAGKRNLPYVKGILQRYRTSGIDEPWTLEKTTPKPQQYRNYGKPQAPKMKVVKDDGNAPVVTPEEMENMLRRARELKGEPA